MKFTRTSTVGPGAAARGRRRLGRDGVGGARASEHKIQVALIDYLAYAGRPELYWFAIPNQSNRHIMNANRMKAEGVRSGSPDLIFLLPEGRVAWLEMKTEVGKLSDTQKAFRDRAVSLGHAWAMARSVDEALVHLTRWDVLKPAYRRRIDFFKTDHLASIQLKSSKEKASDRTKTEDHLGVRAAGTEQGR